MSRDLANALILCNETKRLATKRKSFDATVLCHDALEAAGLTLFKAAKESFHLAMLAGDDRFLTELTQHLCRPTR